MFTQKMHEVQKHATLSNHGYLGYAVIVNKKFWEGLPADVRATLEGAMNEATSFANAIAQTENDDAMAAMKASGKTEFYTLTAAEREAWTKALLPVHKDMEGRVGKELMQAIYKEAAKFGFKY
jgi:C4-dicarboxylate-binding protein DctP